MTSWVGRFVWNALPDSDPPAPIWDYTLPERRFSRFHLIIARQGKIARFQNYCRIAATKA